MKAKFTAVLTAALLATLALAQTVSAQSTTMSFELKNDPTYSVTIPESVSMERSGTLVEIEASEVQNLDGRSISVTIQGTNYYRNQMVLERAVTSGPRDSMRYQIITEDGSVVETMGNKDEVVGVELVSFTGDGVKTYTVQPVVTDTNKPGVFEGTMTFGIELV